MFHWNEKNKTHQFRSIGRNIPSKRYDNSKFYVFFVIIWQNFSYLDINIVRKILEKKIWFFGEREKKNEQEKNGAKQNRWVRKRN